MRILSLLELAYKVVAIACGVTTLYITIAKTIKTNKSKTKRNAPKDVPK